MAAWSAASTGVRWNELEVLPSVKQRFDGDGIVASDEHPGRHLQVLFAERREHIMPFDTPTARPARLQVQRCPLT